MHIINLQGFTLFLIIRILNSQNFISYEDTGGKGADAFHFITYVEHKKSLFELDGLQRNPVLISLFDVCIFLFFVE